MFKHFASALISFASLSMAKKLECEKNAEDGTTCAEIKRETENGDEIMLFPESSVELRLSDKEIKDTKKSGYKGKCYWQLKVYADAAAKAAGEWSTMDGSHEFDGFTVSQQGKCKYNTFLIEAAAATDVPTSATDLEFINSCDIKPEDSDDDDDRRRELGSSSDSESSSDSDSSSESDSDEEDDSPDTTELEEQEEYDNPRLFNTRVQIISNEDEDGDEMDGV